LVVIAAAMLHAVWNALAKSGVDKFVSMTAVVLGHVPIALLILPFVPFPHADSWGYLFVSMVLHTGYQLFLLASYRIGDLTQVYPIARGSAPLLVALVSVVALGVSLSSLELVAIMVVGLGVISLGLVRQTDGLRNIKAAALALVTGCFIASYSLVDGLGVRLAGTALGFYGWQALGNAAILAVFMWIHRPDVFRQLRTTGRHALWIGGPASYLAYSLVVWAFTQAPIALVTALRETSIVFGLLIGVFVMGERLNLVKLGSIVLTLIGAVLIRYSRL